MCRKESCSFAAYLFLAVNDAFYNSVINWEVPIWVKIGYTIIFCIISIFIFSSFANAQKMAQKQELIYNSIGEPATLDPALSTGTQETTLELFVFEGLIRLDKNMNPIPGIAKSWQINQDLTRIYFYIRRMLDNLMANQ